MAALVCPKSSINLSYLTSFYGLDENTVYVLGVDGNLWLEHSVGDLVGGGWVQVPPPRDHVDANVASIQALDPNTVYVLGTDGNLWLEHSISGKFGQVPPPREHVDGSVTAFQALDPNTVYVLGTDGNLWQEHSISGKFGQVPPPREHVDGNVAAFQALDWPNTLYVLGTDGNLWLEYSSLQNFTAPEAPTVSFGPVPPPREHIDGNVADFQAIIVTTTRPPYILRSDGNLWFGGQQVDGNVRAPECFGEVRPLYKVLTVVYAPPGTNGGKSSSSVDYGTGSTTGSTTSTKSAFKEGLSVTASVGGSVGPVKLGASATFSASTTTTDSSSLEVKKSAEYDIKVPGPDHDGIDHQADLFVLWLNPLVKVAMEGHNNISWELGVDGETMEIQYVYASWLQNPTLMPAGLAAVLKQRGLTTTDYANILKLDPFLSGSTVINPDRFQPTTQTFPYEPPPDAGSSPPTFTSAYNSTTTSTTGHETENTTEVSVTVSAGISAPFTASLSTTGTLSWTDTSSQTSTETQTQTASVTVGGPAFGYTGPTSVAVYWDNMYNSFMFTFMDG